MAYSGFLEALLKEEAAGSTARKQSTMTRLAGFPAVKTLDEFTFAANSFSVSDFENQMRLGSRGRSESCQAYQLIQGWVAAAANLDVEIRFFVSQ